MNYQDVKNCIVDELRAGGGTRPAVSIVEIEGKRYVMKDFHLCDQRILKAASPLLVSREIKALELLHDLEQVPNFYKRIDKHVFLMDYAPSARLRGQPFDAPVWAEFEEQLVTLIDAIHERGVAHGDLRSPGNILLHENGSPVIVDFVLSVFTHKKSNPLIRALFNKVAAIDKSAVLKVKNKHATEFMTEADFEKLAQHQAKGRRIKQALYALRRTVQPKKEYK